MMTSDTRYPDDVDIDWSGAEAPGQTGSSDNERFSPTGLELMEQKPLSPGKRKGKKGKAYFELEEDEEEMPPRLGGFVASRYYAERRAERERVREKRRIEAATPKNIEKALQEQRAKSKRRKATRNICPNPVRMVRNFLSDPVTRFWLGCNIFCMLMLGIMSIAFMTFLYPLLLRGVTKY